MKRLCKVLVLASIAIFSISFWPTTARAIRASELKNLRIVNHFFTTRISGKTLEGSGYRFAKDPSESRYLVLIFEATAKKGASLLWGDDFILDFEKDKRDVRSVCKGAAPVKAGITKTFYLRYDSSPPLAELSGTRVSFALAFYLSNEVTRINLCRAGVAGCIKYTLPRERPYSVYVVTRNATSKRINSIKNLLTEGGYQVFSSNSLDKSVNGLHIKYSPQAETVAREISQRFMTKYGVTGKLERMNVYSDNDILIWVGSKVFNDY
jgi:hypothetical protein